MRRVGWWGVATVLAAVALFNCGPSSTQSIDTGGGDVDNGRPDAGLTPQQTDGGVVITPSDAGVVDAGFDGGTDAGSDAGTDGGTVVPVEFPNVPGWTFYGPQNGGPTEVYGVSADEGGNIWVAGGTEGLFLLRPGSTTLEKFGLEDGLHPYGYMPDGSDAPGPYYLKVISVAGGPAGTAFVGYEGKPPGPGQIFCESNWDGPNPDPNIYKSGDADKVTLTSNGIKVVHYDIFSGPNVVRDEPRGREKICNILRIAYDPNTKSVWFGGNHGFAWGRADFGGDKKCNGQLGCAGLYEHVHPAICGPGETLWTDGYHGLAVDKSGDAWFGGVNRATRFRLVTDGDYWSAQTDTEAGNNPWSRIDVWPDSVDEHQCPTQAQMKDDDISSMAAMNDGTVWVGSYAWGLAHLDGSGHVMGYRTGDLISTNVSALAADRWDQSLWVGHRWGGGITRLSGGSVLMYGEKELGEMMAGHPIWDIQSDRASGNRRILVAFQSYDDGQGHIVPGAVGVYSGQ